MQAPTYRVLQVPSIVSHVGNKSRSYDPSSGCVETVRDASCDLAVEADGIPGYQPSQVSSPSRFFRGEGWKQEHTGVGIGAGAAAARLKKPRRPEDRKVPVFIVLYIWQIDT